MTSAMPPSSGPVIYPTPQQQEVVQQRKAPELPMINILVASAPKEPVNVSLNPIQDISKTQQGARLQKSPHPVRKPAKDNTAETIPGYQQAIKSGRLNVAMQSFYGLMRQNRIQGKPALTEAQKALFKNLDQQIQNNIRTISTRIVNEAPPDSGHNTVPEKIMDKLVNPKDPGRPAIAMTLNKLLRNNPNASKIMQTLQDNRVQFSSDPKSILSQTWECVDLPASTYVRERYDTEKKAVQVDGLNIYLNIGGSSEAQDLKGMSGLMGNELTNAMAGAAMVKRQGKSFPMSQAELDKMDSVINLPQELASSIVDAYFRHPEASRRPLTQQELLDSLAKTSLPLSNARKPLEALGYNTDKASPMANLLTYMAVVYGDVPMHPKDSKNLSDQDIQEINRETLNTLLPPEGGTAANQVMDKLLPHIDAIRQLYVNNGGKLEDAYKGQFSGDLKKYQEQLESYIAKHKLNG